MKEIQSTRCLVLASLAVFFLVPASARPEPQDPQYTITDLGWLDPDYRVSAPTAINKSGDVVGASSVIGTCVGTSCEIEPQAFLYTGELGMQPLVPHSLRNWAFGINSHGDVVGSRTPENAIFPATPFIYTSADGAVNDLPGITGDASPLGINDSGQVVGYIGGSNLYGGRAFLLSGTDFVDIDGALPGDRYHSEATGISGSGVVVGWYSGITSTVAYRRSFVRAADGTLSDLPAPTGWLTQAAGVSDAGYIVGTAEGLEGYASVAVRWFDDQIQNLGTLGGPASEGHAVNSRGDVVGVSMTDQPICPGGAYCTWVQHAFLFRDGTLHDLNDLIPPNSGYELLDATAINDVGQITAVAHNSDGWISALLLTPAPLTPEERIQGLVETVEGFGLPKGIENSLLTKLRTALASVEGGGTGSACGPLGAFVQEVQAQSGKKLTVEQANEVIAEAEAIRALLGCA